MTTTDKHPADYPNPGAHTPLRPEWQAARSQSALAAQGEAVAEVVPVLSGRFTTGVRILADVDALAKLPVGTKLYAAPQPSAPGELATQLYDALVATVAAIRSAGVLQHRDYDQLGAKANAAVLAFQRARDTTTNAFPATAQPSADDAPSPEPFRVGNTYRTRGGGFVRFVSVANPGKTYETMVDEFGVHRYTNRVSPLDRGRVTGMAHGDNSVVSLYAAPPADARDAEDARRYRWLRAADCPSAQVIIDLAHDHSILADSEALDQHIDRAMGGES